MLSLGIGAKHSKYYEIDTPSLNWDLKQIQVGPKTIQFNKPGYSQCNLTSLIVTKLLIVMFGLQNIFDKGQFFVLIYVTSFFNISY